MQKLDKENIVRLAKDLNFNLNDKTLETIEENSHRFMYYLEKLNNVDTEGVEALSYPFEDVFPTLREDEVTHTISHEKALENAPKTDGEFIEIVQVIDK